MRIQILGIACPECDQVVERVAEAMQDLGTDAQVELIQDPRTIKSMGIYVTPAILVDGQVKVAGKVPSVSEIKGYISRR
jgi:small redox-active disulfide protein 2